MPTKKTQKRISRRPAANGKASPVAIVFPQEGETVRRGHYAIRVDAKNGAQAEVSFDGKKWTPCREALGLFWFDWRPQDDGRTTIHARAKLGGRYRRALKRNVNVA